MYKYKVFKIIIISGFLVLSIEREREKERETETDGQRRDERETKREKPL